MDTKRHSSAPAKKKSALAAKAVIDSWKPDVVITADDNAVKYLIGPYYKNKKLPFVFCGLNWTAAEYGLPYTNATGMLSSKGNAFTASYFDLENGTYLDDYGNLLAKTQLTAYHVADTPESARRIGERIQQRFEAWLEEDNT